MIKFIFKLIHLFLMNGFLFYLAQYYIWPSIINISPAIIGHVIIGGIFALINIFIKPIVKILSLPFRWLTLGLFGIAINGILLYILSWTLSQYAITIVTLTINGGAFEYILIGIFLAIGNYLMSCGCGKK